VLFNHEKPALLAYGRGLSWGSFGGHVLHLMPCHTEADISETCPRLCISGCPPFLCTGYYYRIFAFIMFYNLSVTLAPTLVTGWDLPA
jgi:hypothetical protein